MRILFIGNFNPAFSTENDLDKTLRIMGHAVMRCQEGTGTDVLVHDVLSTDRPDLIMWAHTHDRAYDWPAAGIIEQTDIPVVAFTLDLFRGLARHDPKYVETHPWFRSKYFFSPDEPGYLRSIGVNAFLSLPGVLSTSCYVAAPDPLHEAFGKVVFVGSRTYHHEHPWRRQLLAWLEKEYGDRFILYDHSSGMRGHALNVLYASANVVVGDSCFASPESKYTSDRFFESLGRGANLVYPRIGWDYKLGNNPLGMFYRAYTPGDYATLGAAIDRAMDQPTHPLDASRWVARNHTYTQRLKDIFETVALTEPSIAEALRMARRAA